MARCAWTEPPTGPPTPAGPRCCPPPVCPTARLVPTLASSAAGTILTNAHVVSDAIQRQYYGGGGQGGGGPGAGSGAGAGSKGITVTLQVGHWREPSAPPSSSRPRNACPSAVVCACLARRCARRTRLSRPAGQPPRPLRSAPRPSTPHPHPPHTNHPHLPRMVAYLRGGW